jgi:hypothetical protein
MIRNNESSQSLATNKSSDSLANMAATNNGTTMQQQQQQQQQQHSMPIIKWNTEKVIEWLSKKLASPTNAWPGVNISSEKIAKLCQTVRSLRLNGETLLELNSDYLDYLNITDDSKLK